MRIFATSLIAAAASAAGITPVHVNPATRFIEDSYGRTVIFHGVNAVYKMAPYIPITDSFDPQESLNDKDIADLVSWGQNFVRLGVMWEAVEREPGVYDDDYLNKIDDLINEMGEAGIYTLVDAHQDVFARTMCGEGIPDFYAKEVIGTSPSCVSPTIDALLKPLYDFMGICIDLNELNYRIDENGDPLIEDCLTVPGGFGTFYDTKQGVNGFGALFENQNGLRDKFVNFWDHTSARFAKNPYVVGYDPLNEPYPGNDVKHPEYRIPGRLDATLLQDTYTEIFERYHKNDEGNAIMWFEPVTQRDINGSFRGGTIFPAGFTNPPGAEIGSDKHVFNDHTYCCQLAGDICATGEPDQSKLDECLVWHNKRIGTRTSDAKRLGVPFMLSEFGACLNEESCTNEIKQVTDVCDEHLIGWAYWQFKYYEDLTTSASAGNGSEGFYNNDGTLMDWKVKALARTYLPFTSGVLTLHKFDTETAEFNAEFTIDGSIQQPSVLYYNYEYWYPNGIQCLVSVYNDGLVDQWTVNGVDNTNYLNIDTAKAEWDGYSATVHCGPSSATFITA